MANKDEKLSRKELKAPDDFQKLGAQAVPFLEKYQRQLLIGGGVLLGIGLIGGAVSEFGKRGHASSQQQLGEALKVLGRPVNANAVAMADGGSLGEDAPFKSEVEKDEALVKALNDVREKGKGTKIASNAALPLGHALLRQGKPAEALAAYDEYLKNSDPADPLRPTALEGKGYAHEAKNEFDLAIAAFDQLGAENKTDFMRGMGMYHHARVLLLQGKNEEGAKLLVDLGTVAPNTSAQRLAIERIALLRAKGVKVPEAKPATPDAG